MKINLGIILTISVLSGILIGIYVGPSVKAFVRNPQLARENVIRQVTSDKIRLTNPLLECGELSQSVSDTALASLRERVETLLNTHKKNGDITYASVYFRDLNNGPWFGINESDEFFPASLLKLPLAMSFYTRAEDEPEIMEKKLTYTPDPNAEKISQPFGPQINVERDKQYRVRELIDLMLRESSNEAAIMLASIASAEQITGIYHDLGLKAPDFRRDYQIDTHKYASFFRILYNATYVDRPASEKLLSVLTETQFRDGLRAGVPDGILVAHKFGSRLVESTGKEQLHDCGIIYAKDNPYILCVMTQGADFRKLATFIKSVSESVYAEVSKRP